MVNFLHEKAYQSIIRVYFGKQITILRLSATRLRRLSLKSWRDDEETGKGHTLTPFVYWESKRFMDANQL